MTAGNSLRTSPDNQAAELSTDKPSLDQQRPIAQLVKLADTILKANSDRSRTQRDAITAFLVRVVSAGILYLSQIALARWMGGHEYGIFVFVWTFVLILGGLSHLGFSTAVIRLIPQYKENAQGSLLRGLLLGSRLFALSVSTIVMLAGMLLLYVLGDRISNDYILPAYLALICVPMYCLLDLQDGIGRANAWMTVALVPPYILRPALILIAMYLFHLTGLPMVAQTAAAAAVIATWVAIVVQTLALQRRLRRLPINMVAETAKNAAFSDRSLDAASPDQPSPPTFAFGKWLKIALPLIVISGCEILLQTTDVLVVSKYMTPSDAGIYFAAGKTMALIMFVHYAVGSAVANRFSTLHARGDKDAMASYVKDTVNWTFWPSLASAAVILALGKPLLWLFGPQFMIGYPIMFVLVIGFLMRSAMGPAEFLLNMMGEQRACAINLSVAAVLTIILNFILVPVFGLIGGATATAISLSALAILNWLVARRKLGLNIAIWQNLPSR